MPSMLSRRWHIFPPKKPVFEGWAACASGEWSSYQFRRDLDAPPSLPPSLVRKSHRRACFGVLPKRVARRHGKFAASRLRVQGPGAVGGGNGPVAGRASPPRPSPLHPLPRPSSLLQRRQPRHEVRTRPRRARAKALTVAAVVVVDGRRLLSRRAPRSTSPSSRTCRERLRVGRCRLDLHFRRGVGRGGRLRRLGGDRGLGGCLGLPMDVVGG